MKHPKVRSLALFSAERAQRRRLEFLVPLPRWTLGPDVIVDTQSDTLGVRRITDVR